MDLVFEIIAGLIITFLLIFLQDSFSESKLGKLFEGVGYAILQTQLAQAAIHHDAQVAVVDISEVPLVKFKDLEGQITPRDPLFRTLTAVANEQPDAIAIDVYFDLDKNGNLTRRDDEFLAKCKRIQDERGIPIYVGLNDSTIFGKSRWLGKPEYGSMGSFIRIPEAKDGHMVREAPRWATPMIQAESSKTSEATPDPESTAFSLSYQLAQVRRGYDSTRRSIGAAISELFPRLLTKNIQIKRAHLEANNFEIDYGGFEAIKNSTLKTTSDGGLVGDGSSLKGKYVLIGRADTEKSPDQFLTPDGLLAGVYVHAAAANTLLGNPLYILTETAHLVLDMGLSSILIGFSAWLGWRTRNIGFIRREWIPPTITFLILFGIVLYATYGIDALGIVWADFIVVFIALLLHGPLAHRLEHLFQRIKHKIKPSQNHQGG